MAEVNESRKLPIPNNVVTVPVDLDDDFFKWWCILLRPFVNLTNREIDVMSCFLKHRHLLSKTVPDSMLDDMLMSDKVKNKVIEECKITHSHFYVVMSNLRKNKVIVNNAINPRLIPNRRETDNGCFQMLIMFKEKQDR